MNNNNTVDNDVLDILVDYVNKHRLDVTKDAKNIIHKFCAEQEKLTITVYRGHGKSQEIRPGLWYSSSKKNKFPLRVFSGKNCCIFKIHLIDIPCIDINKWIGNRIEEDLKEEEEIIFLGGGTFYKNKSLTEEGFSELPKNEQTKKTTFECWYTLNPPQLQIPVEESNKKNDSVKEDYDKLSEIIFRKMKISGGKKRKTQRKKIIRKTSKRKTLRRNSRRK